MTIRTVGGYDFFEVSSAMQKAIRRADAAVAGFFALDQWLQGLCMEAFVHHLRRGLLWNRDRRNRSIMAGTRGRKQESHRTQRAYLCKQSCSSAVRMPEES